jgi:hypothetical protein
MSPGLFVLGFLTLVLLSYNDTMQHCSPWRWIVPEQLACPMAHIYLSTLRIGTDLAVSLAGPCSCGPGCYCCMYGMFWCRMSCLLGSLLLPPCGAPSAATVKESGWGSTAHTHPGEVRHAGEPAAAAAADCLLSTSTTHHNCVIGHAPLCRLL